MTNELLMTNLWIAAGERSATPLWLVVSKVLFAAAL